MRYVMSLCEELMKINLSRQEQLLAQIRVLYKDSFR